jgi:tetratricopeptide (TPR) repeat protein
MTFQYMNYAFSPKEEDGYDKVIASNSNEEGNNLKVSTVEKRNIIDRAFSEPPSRNDALVWLIRTHISRKDMVTAATLIQTLRNDPGFPKRLAPQLAEVTAFWFYNRPQYDSAAFYLEQALPAAANRQEMARWEYLLGQLYSRAGKPEQAKDAFKRCIQHTLNPVMEVAAQLQSTQEINSLDEVDWQAALTALEKMAKREKYTAYRDLIYYTMARIELRRNRVPDAKNHLQKSVKYSINNPEQKTRSYILWGDVAFNQFIYLEASNHYDSANTSLLPEDEAKTVEDRKTILHTLVPFYGVIHRQDSLQKLAALPEAERNAILKKQLRLLRKQQGLKEDDQDQVAGGPVLIPSGNLKASDLFSDNNSGEWYFYNNSLKSRGFTEFRSKWGNRPNTDNWRRSSSVNNVTFNKEIANQEASADSASVNVLSLESLTNQLPIGPEKLKVSNDSILQAQYQLANGIQNKLEDYASAASLYEQLEQRFPGNAVEADILYNLSICYRKLGRNDQLATTIGKLGRDYPNNRQTRLAVDPKGVQDEDSAVSRLATATYNDIYNLYIEGKFEEAIAAKAQADSNFGTHFWTPQLLYIQSIYEMKTRQDSLAIQSLNQIITQFPEHQLSERANNLISVLQRRSEIEGYLDTLQVVRPPSDSVIVLPDETIPEPVAVDSSKTVKSAVAKTELAKNKPSTDSVRLKKEAPVLKATTLFNRHSDQPHFVVLVLDQVDPVYVNEARNAFLRYNKEKYYNQPMNVVIVSLTDQVKLVSISGLANEQAALEYIQQARVQAPKDIIPWLKGNKYYFLPLAQDNLDLLLSNKNLPAYRDFMKQLFPDQY